MKNLIQTLISESLETVLAEQQLPDVVNLIQVERTRDPAHGDFASNIAMIMAKRVGTQPRELATQIVAALPESDQLEKAEIAGPGFINFFLKPDAYHSIIGKIFEQGDHYGESTTGKNRSTLIEFVSANPTGPLHIGHGRGAAYGAAVASLLRKTGFDVSCEYYINDAGRQMDILAVSIWLRYLQQHTEGLVFPDKAYRGDYIKDIAEDISANRQEQLVKGVEQIANIMTETDAELQIDKLIELCKSSLGLADYEMMLDTGLTAILDTIREDLHEFGVIFENWFSERSIVTNEKVDEGIDKLTDAGWVYEKEGARWFSSSKLGDEKDRVLIRENGQATYFASDIAYHLNKIQRGFDKIINVWGADHHGYIPRVKASIKAMGHDEELLEVLLVQFATLYRGKEKLQMSTRSGEFITLKQLQNEVGKDAARFFYILRKSEQHLDFDLELAKSQSNDNPVYYIQYAHARICSVFRQLDEKGYSFNRHEALACLPALTEPHEIALLSNLARYPDIVETAALAYEPHQLAYYLKDLANDFHAYYNANQFLVEQDSIRNARLALIDANKQVIRNGLEILGVSAPEMM